VDRFLWPLAIITSSLLVSVTAIVVVTMLLLPAEGAASVALDLAKNHAIGKAITLVLIVPTIGVLCATGKITGEAAIGLLGALSGYVLGTTV
jgi:uncharacterized membrane protein YqaE (UPF0057 family)